MATVLRADARRLPLPDASVDLIVTSPPYWSLRSYTDGGEHYDGQIGAEPTPSAYVDNLIACTREWVRVLKPSGSLFVNLGDKYAQASERSRNGLSGGLDGGKPLRDAAETVTRPRPSNGVPQKSLFGLPWRYALRCIGSGSALDDPAVVKLLLRDVALGVLTLDDAECVVDDLAATPGDDLGLILRAEVIWSKPNGLPESVTDRVRRSHEQVFHFTRSPRYYTAVDTIREPHQGKPQRRLTPHKAGALGNAARDGGWQGLVRSDLAHDGHLLGALPSSVWEIATEPLKVPAELGIDHFAAYPTELVRRIVLGWSPSGICTACGEGRRPVAVGGGYDPEALARRGTASQEYSHRTASGKPSPLLSVNLSGPEKERYRIPHRITGEACACPDTTAPTRPAVVLDPFGGTGTTALVAKALGRHGITVDRSADYCRLARWRTTDPDQLAKAMRVEKPPKQIDGQADLFEAVG